MDDVPKTPVGFERRGAKYRTRIVVPKELQEIVGKTALVESLKASDREVALKRHRIKWLEFSNVIDAARRELNAKSEISSLSEEEIQSILSVWLHDLLRQDEVDAAKLKNTEGSETIDLIADGIMGDLEALGYELGPDSENPNKKRKISEVETDPTRKAQCPIKQRFGHLLES